MANDSGVGDPYWYEWWIGLREILPMLSPDSNIESVTFQESGVKGLDDVVIRNRDRTMRRIQVKHTRNEETLTFGNLVQGGEESLLAQIAAAWLAAREGTEQCEAVLFTNRTAGDIAAQGENGQQRPPLSTVWPALTAQIQARVPLSSITFPEDCERCQEGWAEWLAAMQVLPQDRRLEFLQSLRILSNQDGLVEIEQELRKRIQTAFQVPDEKVDSILFKLNGCLAYWTTKAFDQRTVTRESALAKMELALQEMRGEHEFPPPAPFFRSRENFVEMLAAALKDPHNRVIFLSGEPGSGKTSIVSELHNRRDPVIDLRFHAFRPLAPGTPLTPSELTATVTAKALWNDLLCLLRKKLRGQLARFNVPVHNGYLTHEELRACVLRIAEELGQERGRPTVIAIDGIDHAARAAALNQQAYSDFLSSLERLDQCSEHVRFLIAGQPTTGYDLYPSYLKTPPPQVLSLTVPPLVNQDLTEEFRLRAQDFPEAERDRAISLIMERAEHNTLAAVFAMAEAALCSNAAELEQRLDERNLDKRKVLGGLDSYYETIWRAALQRLPGEHRLAGAKLAACLALTAEPLTGDALASLIPPRQAVEWDGVLRQLRPLVVEEQDGFRPAFNPVRVFLLGLASREPAVMKEIAGRLAERYAQTAASVLARHIAMLPLLAQAGDAAKLARAFTARYVLEGWAHRRPQAELLEQGRMALRAALAQRDWVGLHETACGLSTLAWRRLFRFPIIQVDDDGLPPFDEGVLLPCERAVSPQNQWTGPELEGVLIDILRLARDKSPDRALRIWNRWFEGLSPVDLVQEIARCFPGEQEIQRAFSLIGRVRYHLALTCLSPDSQPGTSEDLLLEGLAGGMLDEADGMADSRRWAALLREIPQLVPLCDHKLKLFFVRGRFDELSTGLQAMFEQGLTPPDSLEPVAAAAAMFLGKAEWAQAWGNLVGERVRQGRPFLPTYWQNDYDRYVWVALVCGWLQADKPVAQIPRDISPLVKASETRLTPEDLKRVDGLLVAAAQIGQFLQEADKALDVGEISVTPSALGNYVRTLLPTSRDADSPDSYASVAAQLLRTLTGLSVSRLGAGNKPFLEPWWAEVVAACSDFALQFPDTAAVEVVWNFLAQCGEEALLLRWFDYWVGPVGKAWQQKLAERSRLVQKFTRLMAALPGEMELAHQAQARSRWAEIDYSSHERDLLLTPARWFATVAGKEPKVWSTAGVRLLALSREACRVGDDLPKIQVEPDIATAVAQCGPEAIWRLMTATSSQEPQHDWCSAAPGSMFLLDGLIGMLEHLALPSTDLKAIWCLALGRLAWLQDAYDRAYLEHVREAICAAAERQGLTGMRESLEALVPEAFRVPPPQNRKTHPGRWFDRREYPLPPESLAQQIRNVPIGTGIPLLEQAVLDQDVPWTPLREAANKLKQRLPGHADLVARFLTVVMTLGKNRRLATGEGIETVELLFPVLKEEQRWELVQHWIRPFLDDQEDTWLKETGRSLHYFALFQANEEGLQHLNEGLDRVLRMHELWAQAGEHGTINRPLLLEPGQPDAPASWIELVSRLLAGVGDGEEATIGRNALQRVTANGS